MRLPRTQAPRSRVWSSGCLSTVAVSLILRRLRRVRMVLRQQIREKDAMIDNLLTQVNPGPAMATPLTLVPARLPLTPKERTEYRDILTYLERTAQQAGQRFMGDGRTKFDISALEDVMSEDESDTDEDMGVEGATSPKRVSSPKTDAVQSVDTILEVAAPTGIMAAAALQNNRTGARSVQDSSSESSASQQGVDAGVAGESYFLPGAFGRSTTYFRISLSLTQPDRPARKSAAPPLDCRAPGCAGHPALRAGDARGRDGTL